MHLHRVAAFLLGAWLGGSVFMDMVATQNFRSVDRLLADPPAQTAESIQRLGGHDPARVFLRRQVSEQNRWYFNTWEWVQMGLGVALFLALLPGRATGRLLLLLVLLMLVAVLAMHFFLTPEITRLGRAIDFVPPGAQSPERTRFWIFHGAYSTLELTKLVWGLALAVFLVRRKKKQPLPVAAAQQSS
jgi:hypothetical protein